ncbi:MAG: NAD(P)H-hydrate dehydratase [Candidatus Dormibacteria bacterium]
MSTPRGSGMDAGGPGDQGLALGVDITSISRIEGVLRRHPRFAEKIFTEAERNRCGTRAERFASRWAAKEAVMKLHGQLGLRIPPYHAIEVVNRRGGAPVIRIDGRDTGIAVSLTHDAGVAIAVAALPALGPQGAPALPPPRELRLPDRPDDAHKGTFGLVVVVAGAMGTAGAAVLAARGAARAGAGLVRLCVPAGIYAAVAGQCLEVMVHPLGVPWAAGLDPALIPTLAEEHLAKASAIVVGPGLGRAEDTETALLQLLRLVTAPTVVDADALNIAAARGFDWRQCPRPALLTPHPAEMGRLEGIPTAEVQAGRVEVARRYAEENAVTVVLKGSETVVAAADGRVFVDGHRTVALATGGTGDVLSGVCGAMLAAGLDAFDAAVAAVTVHAEAGCLAQAWRGRAGALAGDVAEMLPAAQERLRRALERRAPR